MVSMLRSSLSNQGCQKTREQAIPHEDRFLNAIRPASPLDAMNAFTSGSQSQQAAGRTHSNLSRTSSPPPAPSTPSVPIKQPLGCRHEHTLVRGGKNDFEADVQWKPDAGGHGEEEAMKSSVA